MNRAGLEHILRAAAAVSNEREIIVIGSQSVLEQFPDAPEVLLTSIEADVFPQARRLLVAHEHATRKPPAGIQVIDAWRYLLDAPLKAWAQHRRGIEVWRRSFRWVQPRRGNR
jgi:hypothetical protein